MPHDDDFRDDRATSFNNRGCYNSNYWDDLSPYQEPPPPPPHQDNHMTMLLPALQELAQRMEQMSLRIQANRDALLEIRQDSEASQANLERLESQIVQLAAETTSPYIPTPQNEPIPYEEFESEKEDFEGEEGSEVVNQKESGGEKNEEVEEEKEKEMEIEKERERAPIPTKETPLPYPEEKELSTEDATLIKLIKDYVASCSLEELWGKGAHEKEKENEQVYVPEIEEALLNTPLEVVKVPLEIMSEPTNRDPSEVSRYGRKQQDLREDRTKKPGKEFKLKRKASKLRLFLSYFKSRWRDTFNGLHTISGLDFGPWAKRNMPLEGKRDLRPP